ncbi:MAG: Gfo/Idh/MocA family protein [Eubacteriales bacterium]|jgi:predicted dehydrogenase
MALKIGIVGCGGIGKTHAKVYVNDPLAQLVAFADIVPEKAEAHAKEFGVKAYPSLKAMLEAEPDLDIIDVTTSGYENGSWHYEPAMEGLRAGKTVFVEKPISNDIFEAREMVRYAYEHDLYLACNLNHYFTQPADRAKELIQAGKVGEPVYILHKMGFNGSDVKYGGIGSPRWQKPYAHTKAFLSHPFSLMRYFGGDITHVQCFMNRAGVRSTAADPMYSINSIHCRFENGSVGYLISQRGDAMFGLGGWWSFEMAGTKGTFVIENCVEKLMYWDATTPKDSMTSPTPDEVLDTGISDFGTTFQNRLHAFLEDVTNKVPKEHLRSSGRDALATLEYTFAAIKSFEEGGSLVRVEPLPNLHGDPKYVW